MIACCFITQLESELTDAFITDTALFELRLKADTAATSELRSSTQWSPSGE